MDLRTRAQLLKNNDSMDIEEYKERVETVKQI